MSEEVIMKDFRKITTDLIKNASEPELRMLKIKVEREMNERMEAAEKKYLKGGYTLNKPRYKS
jgi:hypothetical protein